MERQIISREEILMLSPFKELADRPLYAAHYDRIIRYMQRGAEMDPAEVIGKLLSKSCYYCGISSTWRTIFYGFAESVLDTHRELWNVRELKEDGIFLHNHFKRFYPEYKGEFDKYDITLLYPADEWFYAFKMWREGFVSDEIKPAFFYGMYCNFKIATEFYDFADEEFMDALTELEEDD